MTVTRAKCAFLSTLGLVLVSALPAAAQAGLEVTVVEREGGDPVAGAEVLLENPDIGYTTRAATNGQGKVRFAALSTAGSYTIVVSPTGDLLEQCAENIVLRANSVASVKLLLERPVLEERVRVEAARNDVARINTVNAEVSSTLTQEELRALPVEGRDLTRALYWLPNVTQATGFYPEAPNVSINGANSLFTSYMIDGLDNNENFLGGQKFAVPLGFVQDVSVLTMNYSAELGRTGNGIVNVTSRSGNNDLSSEAYYVTRPGPPLDSASPFAQRDLSGNEVKDGFERHQIGASIGGPFVKDKTFFLFDLELTRDAKDNLLDAPALGVNDTVRGRNRFDYFSGKIDQVWTPRFKSAFRVNVGDVSIERQGGGLEGGIVFPSAANTQDRKSALVAISNRWAGGRWVSETNAQYGRFRWNYGRPDGGAGPQTAVRDPTDQTIALLGHPGFVFDDIEDTVQLQQKVTYALGNHLVKTGAEVLSSDFSLTGGGNVDGNYTVRLTQAELDQVIALDRGQELDVEDIPASADVVDYNVELQTKSFGKRQNIFSLYGEDLWSPTSRLNLTFALRYDYDTLSKGGASTGDRDNVAPRVGGNYHITPRSVVRGGAGMFYDKILYAVYSDALQQNSTSDGFRSQIQQLIALGILPSDTNLDRVLFDGNISADFTSGIPYLGGPSAESLQGERENVVSNDRRILNPNGYDNPYTNHFSVGYQRQLDAQTLFYVDLVRTRSYHQFRLRDLNAPAPYPLDRDNVVVRTQAEADATRPVAIVPGGARNIVISETEGSSRYWAGNFTLIGNRGRLPFGYRLSYTLSRLTNNTDDINFRAQDANDFAAEWGPSLNDRRHVISGFVYTNPIPSVTLTVATLFQSGQPVNRIPDAALYGTTDLNGDGRSFGDAYVGNSDRSPGERRNSDRLPWPETVDLSVTYRWTVRKGALELRADVFNVLNEKNLSGYSNNATQSNQIQIGPESYGIVEKNAAPPRQFQFGVRYAF